MIEGTVDLHLHSIHSDGSYTPSEIVERALARSLVGIALTDHDSVDGLDEARARAAGTGLAVLAGCELSAIEGAIEVHVLAYLVDDHDPEFRAALVRFREARLLRAHAILAKLDALGLPLSWDDVLERAQGGAIGRPHIAEALMVAGYVENRDEAFRRYLSNQGPAYVPKRNLTTRGAIELVRRAGGVPVVAHPATMQRDAVIAEAVPYGLGGLEVIHPSHDESARRRYQALCDRYQLVATGGSDCHGVRSYRGQIGDGDVPASVLDELRAEAVHPGIVAGARRARSARRRPVATSRCDPRPA